MKEKIKIIVDIRPIIDTNQYYHYFYRIRNKINSKEYYGIHSTKNLNDGYSGSGVALNKAIKKYGIDCFYLQVLKFFKTRKECSDFEKSIVTEEYLDSNKQNTYNLVGGGENGHFIPFDVRRKISKSEKGKIVSKETREKNGLAHKGQKPWNKSLFGKNNPQTEKKRSIKTKINISNGLLKYYSTNDSIFKGQKRDKNFCNAVSNGKKGVLFSDIHKLHLSQSHTGLKHSDETKNKISKSSIENPRGYCLPKKVLCIELKIEFSSAKYAYNQLRIKYNFPNYQNFCKKIRQQKQIDGLTFKYIDLKENENDKCN